MSGIIALPIAIALLAGCSPSTGGVTQPSTSLDLSSARLMPRPTCNADLQPCNQLWVAVYTGGSDADFVLELGPDEAYTVPGDGGGVVSRAGAQELAARVLELPSCNAVAEFTAYPGSFHVVRVSETGTLTVTNETGRLSPESGPGLGEPNAANC